MDKIIEEPFLGFKKRKVGPSTDTIEELPRTPKRRTQQNVTPAQQTMADYKRAKEDQSEKYILDLEMKNKSLLAKITDLSNLNKRLSRENTEMCNKLKQSDNGQNPPPVEDIVKPLSIEPPKIVPRKQESRGKVLNTQALIALWNEVSATPLPECGCNKSEALVRRRANAVTKKFKEYIKPGSKKYKM